MLLFPILVPPWCLSACAYFFFFCDGKQKSQVLWVPLMGRTISLNLCSSGSCRSRTVWAWIRRPRCKQSSHSPANHRPIAGGPDTDLQYPESAGKQGVCVQRELCIHSAFDLRGETIWSSFKRREWRWRGRPRRTILLYHAAR